MVADQNTKLSIFATRPAIYSPVFNFITEAMGTVALILLALLIELQVRAAGEWCTLVLEFVSKLTDRIVHCGVLWNGKNLARGDSN